MSFLDSVLKIFGQKNVVKKQAPTDQPRPQYTPRQNDYQRPERPVRPEPRDNRAEKAAADRQAELIIQSANNKAREVILEAKDAAYKIKLDTDREIQKMRADVIGIEKKIAEKEESLDRKLSSIEAKETGLKDKENAWNEKLQEVEKTKADFLIRLEKVAGLTKDDAKNLLLSALQMKLAAEKAAMIRESERSAKEEIEQKVKNLLVNTMVHGATDYVSEYTISVVKLPDEDMKGRIIGKEGRNIRSLETQTGVEFDVDNTPGEIRLSCFDPVRREIARLTLERLMADGRIQPSKIEEIVERTKRDIDKVIFEEGTKLCHAVGVYNLHTEIVQLLGRFKYRFSYGQNMIAHTLEETRIGIALANEIHADVNVVRLGCLLHDIGKVINDEEGSHVELGVKFLRKLGIPEEVVACVAEHHEDHEFSSNESMIVYISDAISGSRPGARYEDLTAYIKRLTELETIGKSFKGVEEVFAFQAGRELRVIVNPDKLTDDQAVVVAHDIKEKIEEKIKNFPGQIRITVIREKRIVQMAK
jgi:ribonucrease Y